MPPRSVQRRFGQEGRLFQKASSASCWSARWHGLGYERFGHIMKQSGVHSWSQVTLKQYWRFAAYIATLPETRWLRRVLAWSFTGHKCLGRPRFTWDEELSFLLAQWFGKL